jgi:hypothetical protein
MVHHLLRLPVAAVRLVARLAGRKRQWLRAAKVFAAYPELGLSTAAEFSDLLALLLEAGLVDQNAPDLDLKALLLLLSVAELDALCAACKVRPVAGAKRDKLSLVDVLVHQCGTQRTLLGESSEELMRRRVRKTLGQVIRLSATFASIEARFETVFFLRESHEDQTLQTMALVNMGRIVYPAVSLPPARTLLFATRDTLLQYQLALDTEATVVRLVEKHDTTVLLESYHTQVRASFVAAPWCMEAVNDVAIDDDDDDVVFVPMQVGVCFLGVICN